MRGEKHAARRKKQICLVQTRGSNTREKNYIFLAKFEKRPCCRLGGGLTLLKSELVRGMDRIVRVKHVMYVFQI